MKIMKISVINFKYDKKPTSTVTIIVYENNHVYNNFTNDI